MATNRRRERIKAAIRAELTKDKFLKHTNWANREVYVVDAHNSPYTMAEIGRLRSLTFNSAGKGSFIIQQIRGSLKLDIDRFDTMAKPYQQLIVYDPNDDEIIGGYRFIDGKDVVFDKKNVPQVSTNEIFNFSDKFKKDYLPNILELGRSFVQPKYQSSRSGIFSLDNLWDGIGGVAKQRENLLGFWGKVTMYKNYNMEARDHILYFLDKFYGDKENLVRPFSPIKIKRKIEPIAELFKDLSSEEAYRVLNKKVRELGENIPPLLNSYIKLSPSMIYFGASTNTYFGNTEELGIFIKLSDIYPDKKDRHLQ